MWNSKILQFGKVLTFKVFTNGTNAIKVVDTCFKLKKTSLNTCEHSKATTCIEFLNFFFYKLECFNACI
jgi:hypothetical protein